MGGDAGKRLSAHNCFTAGLYRDAERSRGKIFDFSVAGTGQRVYTEGVEHRKVQRSCHENIILASASPRRKDLLAQAGIPFEVCVSEVEEAIDTRDPAQAVETLSALKCRDVFEKISGDVLVIGADTVVAFEGKIYGKPGSEKEAEEMLGNLQGNHHQVYTGVTVLIREGKEEKR